MGKSKRREIREKRVRNQRRNRLILIGLGVVILAGLGALIWPSLQPAVGEAAPVMSDTSHVVEGEDPGPYNTNPPTSGKHYASQYNAGFYNEGDPQTLVPHPEGYLIHSLEHGYVIFWYNCEAEGAGDCEQLKSQIQSVMDKADNFKVIAFPYESIEEPVVMTSWGRIHRFERFNTWQAEEFVERNRNKAPEPHAP